VMIQDGGIIFEGTPEELGGCQDPAIRGFLDPGSLPPEAWEALSSRVTG